MCFLDSEYLQDNVEERKYQLYAIMHGIYAGRRKRQGRVAKDPTNKKYMDLVTLKGPCKKK